MNKTILVIFVTLTLVIAIGFYKKANNTQESERLYTKITKDETQLRIIDGDTFELNGTKIRIYGIDAFEKKQKCLRQTKYIDCGYMASEYLSFLLTGNDISCTKKSSDKYGRDVSICTVNGIDIGKMMVRQGWAKAYTKYSNLYSQDEDFAKKNSLGAWSTEFIEPEKQRSNKNE